MARRILLALFAAAAFAPLSRPALAQHAPEIAQGPDEVVFKNGGMLRGTVVAVEPGRSVTLLLMLTGEQRVVPWAKVERVDRGKHAPKASAPVTPAAPSSADRERAERELELAHARGERGVVRVHIDAPDPGVQLYRLNTSASPGALGPSTSSVAPLPPSEVLCIAPCDKVIDGRLGQQFFFAGKDMPASSTFQVFSRAGALGARVEPGSEGRLVGGLALGVSGGLTVSAGIAVTVLGLVDGQRHKLNPDGTSMLDANGTVIMERGPMIRGGEISGPITVGVGLAMLVGGIFLGLSGETKYSLSPKESAPAIALSPAGVALVF